ARRLIGRRERFIARGEECESTQCDDPHQQQRAPPSSRPGMQCALAWAAVASPCHDRSWPENSEKWETPTAGSPITSQSLRKVSMPPKNAKGPDLVLVKFQLLCRELHWNCDAPRPGPRASQCYRTLLLHILHTCASRGKATRPRREAVRRAGVWAVGGGAS